MYPLTTAGPLQSLRARFLRVPSIELKKLLVNAMRFVTFAIGKECHTIVSNSQVPLEEECQAAEPNAREPKKCPSLVSGRL